jgi:hypothetical protein
VRQAINPRIRITREEMHLLVAAGIGYQTVRLWFLQESGPHRNRIPRIEEILGRDLEIVVLQEKASPTPESPGADPDVLTSEEPYPEGTGFCWVPMSAWEKEGLTREQVCKECVKLRHCRKAEAVA